MAIETILKNGASKPVDAIPHAQGDHEWLDLINPTLLGEFPDPQEAARLLNEIADRPRQGRLYVTIAKDALNYQRRDRK